MGFSVTNTRKLVSTSYSQQFIRFILHVIVFIVSAVIIAGIVYAFDKNEMKIRKVYMDMERYEKYREKRVMKMLDRTSGIEALRSFSNQHTVNVDDLKEFAHTLSRLYLYGTEKFNASSKVLHYTRRRRGVDFLQSFVLALSTMTTVGWNHVLPVSDGAKAITCVSAIIGIPLTILMVISGAHIIMRANKDMLDRICRGRAVNLYKYFLCIYIIAYILLTAAIIGRIEGFDYSSALWYSIMSLTTVGYGDVFQKSVLVTGTEDKKSGVATFLMFWLIFGFVFVGALVLSIIYDELDKANSQIHFNQEIYIENNTDTVDLVNEGIDDL